jgi:hypothetical protein
MEWGHAWLWKTKACGQTPSSKLLMFIIFKIETAVVGFARSLHKLWRLAYTLPGYTID